MARVNSLADGVHAGKGIINRYFFFPVVLFYPWFRKICMFAIDIFVLNSAFNLTV